MGGALIRVDILLYLQYASFSSMSTFKVITNKRIISTVAFLLEVSHSLPLRQVGFGRQVPHPSQEELPKNLLYFVRFSGLILIRKLINSVIQEGNLNTPSRTCLSESRSRHPRCAKPFFWLTVTYEVVRSVER